VQPTRRICPARVSEMLLKVSLLLAAACALIYSAEAATKKDEEAAKSTKLSPCESCRLYVTAFRKRVDATARNSDGDVNLSEVHRRTCDGIGRGEYQCKIDAQKHRALVDEWWAADRQTDLAEWLCDQKLKVCVQIFNFNLTFQGILINAIENSNVAFHNIMKRRTT
jgi:hypothetical protein